MWLLIIVAAFVALLPAVSGMLLRNVDSLLLEREILGDTSVKAWRDGLATTLGNRQNTYLAGILEAQQGNLQGAEAKLVASDRQSARFALGNLLWSEGDRARAIESWQLADAGGHFYGEAMRLYSDGEIADAYNAVAIMLAVERVPNLAQQLFAVRIALDVGDLAQAGNQLAHLEQEAAGNADVLLLRARFELLQKHETSADSYFLEAVEILKKNPSQDTHLLASTMIDIGTQFRNAGMPDGALMWYQRASAYSASAEGIALAEAGITLWGARRYVEALDALEAASRIDPGNARIWRFLAIVRANQQDYRGAVRDMESALAIEPDNLLLQFEWSELLACSGQALLAGDVASALDAAARTSIQEKSLIPSCQ